MVTIRDMVRAQAMLIDRLGIDTLFAVIGGSMGGMQVLQWAASYPRARVLRHAGGDRRAALQPEHRLPRGRPPGGHGRPGLVQGPLPRRGAPPRQGARRGAHGGAHHLPLQRGAAAQVRPQAAGAQTRRPSPSTPISRSRTTCATRASPSSTGSTPIPTSTSPAPATTSTSPPTTAGAWPTPSAAPRPSSAWCPSRRTGSTRPRPRATSFTR